MIHIMIVHDEDVRFVEKAITGLAGLSVMKIEHYEPSYSKMYVDIITYNDMYWIGVEVGKLKYIEADKNHIKT